jgi:hypothetical protein
MTPEEILKKLIERGPSSDDSKLLGAASLVTATRAKELTDASVFLAKTTKDSAELLAKTTEESALQLRRSNKISEGQMKLLTIVLVVVSIVQTIIAIVAVVISLKLK